MKLAGLLCLLASLLCAPCGYGSDVVQRAKHENNRKLWWLSVAALTAATAVDIQSSTGKYEQNSLLQNGSGQFNLTRGLTVKVGMVGAVLGVQYLLYRRQKEIPMMTAVGNLAGAGMLSAIALHNVHVPRAAPVATPLVTPQSGY